MGAVALGAANNFRKSGRCPNFSSLRPKLSISHGNADSAQSRNTYWRQPRSISKLQGRQNISGRMDFWYKNTRLHPKIFSALSGRLKPLMSQSDGLSPNMGSLSTNFWPRPLPPSPCSQGQTELLRTPGIFVYLDVWYVFLRRLVRG